MAIKIAMLVDSPSRWAHGNAASRLALGLTQTGVVKPTLLCYGDDPAPAWIPPSVQVDRLGVERASRTIRPLVRYLRTIRPDVLITRQVHANFFGLAAAWASRMVSSSWEGKLILVQDHPIELSHAANWRDNKWAVKACYRFADGVISPSPFVRENIIRWCGLDPVSVALVPNATAPFSGLTERPPHPWLREGQPPVFVQASNMKHWKRLDLLLEAFTEVRKSSEVRLLILGDGDGRAEAIERIQRLELTGCAELTGWVDDPLQYAARAHAFVLTSDEEGFAQVLTESMSVGCPVITTDAHGGGPRFVTGDGEFGILVPRRDRNAIAAAMRTMLDSNTREHYSELGRQRAAELSPESCAALLLEFLADRVGLRIDA